MTRTHGRGIRVASRRLDQEASCANCDRSCSNIQSAATLLPIDYGAYTFSSSGPGRHRIPDPPVVLFEVGYFLRDLRISPVFQFTRRNIAGTTAGDETRWSAGVNYWWRGHNANVMAVWGRIDPRGGFEQNQLTVQLQVFYF